MVDTTDPVAVYIHNQQEFEQLEKHLHYLYDHHENEAVRIALNEVARKCKTNIVRAVASEPLQQSLRGAKFSQQQLDRLPPLTARQKDVRPLIHVRAAKKRNVEPGKPSEVVIIGYANDIPAMRLATVKKQKTGNRVSAGKFSHAATKGSRGRKLKQARLGGITIRGVTLPDAFVNVARYNNQVHVMRRIKTKTWKPGMHGWGHAKNKAPTKNREPFGVVKYDVKTPMEAKMQRVVNFTVAVNAQDSYDRAMGYLIGKSATMNFK